MDTLHVPQKQDYANCGLHIIADVAVLRTERTM